MLAALLESEQDLLSVLLVRAERLAHGDEPGRRQLEAIRDELAAVDLRRAMFLTATGVDPAVTFDELIAGAADPSARRVLSAAAAELRYLVGEVEAAAAEAGMAWLVPRSLRDFVLGPAGG